jgi:hypothetical protein
MGASASKKNTTLSTINTEDVGSQNFDLSQFQNLHLEGQDIIQTVLLAQHFDKTSLFNTLPRDVVNNILEWYE